MASLTCSPTLLALSEDLRTAWAPDPLGLVDAESLLAQDVRDGTIGQVEQLWFPKPDGSSLRAPVLGLPAMGQLHRAVERLRDPIDVKLAAGVCGYRQGAEEGFSYSAENVRFQQITEAEGEQYKFVVFADVRQFFEHCPWELVIDQLDGLVGDQADVDPLRRFAQSATASGLSQLPAGYANSRLLANAVLATVDDAIGETFVRWVDDYRIFVDSAADAERALGRLRQALGRLNMSLNETKTTIVTSVEMASRNDAGLESVYHPDIESPDQVRAALRSVFIQAVQSPSSNRRSLRFVLPRLAAQKDDIALDWVLSSLESRPWEAPRFAMYLGAFAGERKVRDASQAALDRALSAPSLWLAIRLAALTCHTGLDVRGAATVAEAATQTQSPALWSLLVRSLAVSGHTRKVQEVLQAGVQDQRGAFAARRDLGIPGGDVDPPVSFGTLRALADGMAPLPDISTIL